MTRKDVEVDLDQTYTITISESVNPIYSISQEISNWLQENLSTLTDDNDNVIFGKVNQGFSDESLRTFGKKPVCDVYINNIEYDSTFDSQTPDIVHTFVLFYLKGANSHTYSVVCGIHDLIMQEFLTNDDWQRLDDIVRDTVINRSEIRIQPVGKKWGVIGAFELNHQLY